MTKPLPLGHVRVIARDGSRALAWLEPQVWVQPEDGSKPYLVPWNELGTDFQFDPDQTVHEEPTP